MADTARNVTEREEFWRPPMHAVSAAEPITRSDKCEECGGDYVAGSRFCHVCGAAREPHSSSRRFSVSGLVWRRIHDALGMGTGPLLAFVVGVACVLGALITGLVYSATTVMDWQAVQAWRIEWLLAGIAAFAAGALLKKTVS